MTITYADPRHRLLSTAPPADLIGDPGLREAVEAWHQLNVQASEARHIDNGGPARIRAAEVADQAARAGAVKDGRPLPTETLHQVRAEVEQAHQLALALDGARELAAGEVLAEVARVQQGPEGQRLRDVDAEAAKRERAAEQALEAVRAERRRGSAYSYWLADPSSPKRVFG